MSTHRSAFHLSLLLLTALSSTTFAQSSACADQLSAGVPCCGQYECVEDRPLSLAEAQASRRYPQFARPEPHNAARIAGPASLRQPRQGTSTVSAGDERHD